MNVRSLVLSIAVAVSCAQPALAHDTVPAQHERHGKTGAIIGAIAGGIIGAIIAGRHRGGGDGRDNRDQYQCDPRFERCDDGYDRGPGSDQGGWDRGQDRRGPPRRIVCYAEDVQGRTYPGQSFDVRDAQQRALDACYRYANRCRPADCQQQY